jgi:hypothetical protein
VLSVDRGVGRASGRGHGRDGLLDDLNGNGAVDRGDAQAVF